MKIGEIKVRKKIIIPEIKIGVQKISPPLINLDVEPTAEEQIFKHEGSYGYDEVKVNAVKGETLNIVPSKEGQKFNGIYTEVNLEGLVTSKLTIIPTKEEQSHEGLFEIVDVKAVTSDVDENIIPDNIKQGVEILGVTGTMAGGRYRPRKISFSGYEGTELDYEVANLDTSELTAMNQLFYSCSNLQQLNLAHFVTSKVTTMAQMFSICNDLAELDISNFNTSQVTAMNQMFYACYKLTSLNLSHFDTSKVTQFSGMFQACDGLTNVDISNFNTEKATRMNQMFYNCSGLASLDLKSFIITNVTNTQQMFDGCKKLGFLDIRNFVFDKVTTYANMFRNVPANCLIIVKGETEKAWVFDKRNDLTNIKTVAEYQAEGGV